MGFIKGTVYDTIATTVDTLAKTAVVEGDFEPPSGSEALAYAQAALAFANAAHVLMQIENDH